MPRNDFPGQSVPISRRAFLGAAGGLAIGTGLSGSGREAASTSPESFRGLDRRDVVPFYGQHQAGITTSPQRHSYFAAFDVQTGQRKALVALLRTWTSVAASVCTGSASVHQARLEPPRDGRAGIGTARLTVNFGFGPTLFGVGGPDRFGLRARWPMALVEVPGFASDQIAPMNAGGDLIAHACADEPQVAFQAVQLLARSALGTATVRWTQRGFNRAGSTGGAPRDPLGFKDGIVNPTSPSELEQFVWVGEGQDQAWMSGGTYLVVRRIRLSLDRWNAETVETQERIIGRHKISGAPLGQESENDPLDLDARGPDGRLVIPIDAHVRMASPAANWGQMVLRRSYAYDNGTISLSDGDPGVTNAGAADSGLFFCCYQQNPRLAFIPMYSRLSTGDALRSFTVHTASAVAALPPGVPDPGHFIGEQLFA